MPPLDGTRVIEDVNHTELDGDVRVRMESLAHMGSALAAEVVPLLTVLNNILQLARVGLEKGEPSRQAAINSMTDADRAMKSATSLMRRLEDFGRCHQSRPETVDLSSFVMSRRQSMSGVLGCGIRFRIRAAQVPCPIDIDPRRLEQVIVELLRNASESMRGSGTIGIRVEHHGVADAGACMARLVIEDEGPGMDAESMQQAFEPSFTTKHHDRGIGLGLSMSCAIISAAGGHMSLTDRGGHGLRVTVDLPLNTGTESVPVDGQEDPAISRDSVA